MGILNGGFGSHISITFHNYYKKGAIYNKYVHYL